MFAFHSVDICTAITEAMVGQSTGALEPMKAVTTCCSSSHCHLGCHALAMGGKKKEKKKKKKKEVKGKKKKDQVHSRMSLVAW